MRSRISLPSLIAISLLASGTLASAQVNTGGGTPGSAGVIGSPAAPPVQNSGSAGISSAPASASPTGTSTTTGSSVTTSSSSRLPGDNPSAPGFPGKVGR